MRFEENTEDCPLYWGGTRNSVTITTPQGETQTLTVPVYGSRRPQPFREIRICYMHAWQRQHWAALYSAYGKKPYWEYYADYIRPLYEDRPEFLWQLNERINHILCCLLSNVRPDLTPVSGHKTVQKEKILDFLMEFGPECHHLAL